MSTEHQVVVVLDICGPDDLTLDDAGRAAVGILNGTRGTHVVNGQVARAWLDSWWFPERELKHIDGNDNTAMVLVRDDDEPVDVPDGGRGLEHSGHTFWREVDADGDMTIWTGPEHRPHALLASYQINAGIFDTAAKQDAANALWDLLCQLIPARTEVPA